MFASFIVLADCFVMIEGDLEGVIKEGEEILVLKCPGKHYFHGACIKPWLRNKMSCPTCRNSNII